MFSKFTYFLFYIVSKSVQYAFCDLFNQKEHAKQHKILNSKHQTEQYTTSQYINQMKRSDNAIKTIFYRFF
ncbi:hypothetical protein D1Z84_27400 [Escherichia coli]|nr:hypothetical protein [Escherichia coli]